MSGFIKGDNRQQATLISGTPRRLHIGGQLGTRDRFIYRFSQAKEAWYFYLTQKKGRPGYDPALMLKLYVY